MKMEHHSILFVLFLLGGSCITLMEYNQDGWLKRAKGPIICQKKSLQQIISLGNDDQLHDSFSIFALQFILMSLVSHALYIILKPLKQPKFVCNALSGIIVSPHIQRHAKPYEEKFFPLQELVITRTVAYFGLVYYIFIVAVKMDLNVVQRTARKASIIGLSSLLAPFAVILLTAFELPSLGLRPGLFLCLFSGGLSQTRFPHVAYAFHELDIMTSDLAQLAMSSSVVHEMSSFLWKMAFLLHTQNVSAILVVLSVVVFLLLISFVTPPIVSLITKDTPEGKQVKEEYIVLILLGALNTTVIGDMIGTILFGVLLMGLIIPNGPPLGATLTERVENVVMDLLMPMFYIVVGYSTDVSSLDLKASWEIILCILLSALAKFLGAFASAMCCRFKFGHATLLGLMMNVRGPLDFFIFVDWLKTKDIEVKTYTVLVLSQILLMAILSPLIEGLYDASVRLKSVDKRRGKSIQTTATNVELRILCCIQDEESVMGIISVIEAMKSSMSSPMRTYVVHQNEVIGCATPFIAPYNQQLKRKTPKNCHHIMQAFENYSRNSNILMKLKPYVVTAPYKSMHEYVCKLAQGELVTLIIVPFHGNHEVSVPQIAFSLRSVNRNIQVYTPCTVGILVDNGMRNCMTLSSFSCAIAVVFIGGADDREALTLATRMAGHTGVRVMLLQIIVEEENVIEEREKKLDFAVVDQFMVRAVNNNGRGTHREVITSNVKDAMYEIRMLGDQYNLIIVGHQQKTTKLRFQDVMLNWTENPELGVFGDLIASSCSSRGMTSVLVMKH